MSDKKSIKIGNADFTDDKMCVGMDFEDFRKVYAGVLNVDIKETFIKLGGKIEVIKISTKKDSKK